MTVQKTYIPKAEEITQEWYLVDANDQTLGRLATKIASVILGKHKPIFTPGVDTGDFVVVVNAERISVTGNKLEDKMYYRHSQYPGGFKKITLRDQLEKAPRPCDSPCGVGHAASQQARTPADQEAKNLCWP
jgi:large subunit ribosomal protein L13